MLVDLHCHSTCSDGTLTPSQLVRHAASAGLGMVALTDHDSVAGCLEAEATAQKEKLAVRVIKGVELSLAYLTDEVHLVGLQIDAENPALCARLAEFKADRQKRLDKIIKKLAILGYPLQEKDILQHIPRSNQSIGRPHVAAALVGKGYFTSIQTVFDQLLYTGGPAYVPHLRATLPEALNLIHGAGGLAILAHPYTVRNPAIIREAVALGLDGLEAYYPEHTPEQVAFYKGFAHKNNLKVSGGSDFHGRADRYPAKLGQYALSVQLLNLW